ncbi:MAG: hypothetical protein HLUCCA11_19455 [Phormidesmis priestleyi Ana]|uniref:Uncharacterized protein n=1 Tax=Phormidesmis priestleyi Ana TaxID=1666911 RepID=A0A0P8BHI7_9CYAN|nr:MAG: hypothetical protein HLUCCA11_19455 [Phormidesmis priestleyi Ana]
METGSLVKRAPAGELAVTGSHALGIPIEWKRESQGAVEAEIRRRFPRAGNPN